VRGPVSPYSGYGSDTIGIVLTLLRMGADVLLHPTHLDPPVPPEVAALLTKRLDPPFDLVINHWDPTTLEVSDGQRRSARVVVGWTMWEFTSLDNCRGRSNLKPRSRDFDLIFGYDENTVQALRPHVNRKVPLVVLQGGYDSRRWPPAERDWHSQRFGFVMHGALHARKDPFAAFQAFQDAQRADPDGFGRYATLSFHTTALYLHPRMADHNPKIRIFHEVWPEEILYQFYAKNHVLVAPSRGEGKNLPAIEMLSTGGTVIASDFGGHRQWLDPSYAYPLRVSLAPHAPNLPNCLEARVDQAHLTELMLHCFRSRSEARDKGLRAQEQVPARCDWSVVMDRFWLRLRDAIPGAGGELYAEAQELRQRQQTHRYATAVNAAASRPVS
jgi:glycosyltransferase involved in cell wall biosynthesis